MGKIRRKCEMMVKREPYMLSWEHHTQESHIEIQI